MPKPTPQLILVLIALLVVTIAFLSYKNYKTKTALQNWGFDMQLPQDSASNLPEIEKPQSNPSVSLSLVEAEAENTMYVMIDSEDAMQVLDGLEMIIHFDPDFVTNVTLEPSKIFSSVVRNTVSAEQGVIDFAVIRLPGETVIVDTKKILATITYEPKQAGNIMFSFAPDATVVAGNQGDNILKSVQDIAITKN